MPTPAEIPAPSLALRHQPSGLNTLFQGARLAFDDYLGATHTMLCAAHQALGTAELEQVVAGNMPFKLEPEHKNGTDKPYRRGILLTHGLTDSPYFMRHLASFFQAQGFLVLAILLPGHGTQPGDLLETRWQEWAKAVAYGTDCLARQVEEVYLGGLSTGATLSLYQSIKDARVFGLFMFSPALQITPRAAYANWHKLYSRFIPQAKWVTIQPDTDRYKYESFAKNAAAQMHALTQATPTSPLDIPIFSVASRDDATVDATATWDFMAKTLHPRSKLLWYSTTPPAAANLDTRVIWVNSALPQRKILSSAHTAIVLAAEDAHYGERGHYRNCSHYYPHQMDEYLVCRNHLAPIAQGEITPEYLQAGILRRLMYNPDFSGMTQMMERFIATLP